MDNIFLTIECFKDLQNRELTQEDSEILLVSMMLYEEVLDKHRVFLKYDINFEEQLSAFNKKLDVFRDIVHKYRLSLGEDEISSVDKRLKELGRSISMGFN